MTPGGPGAKAASAAISSWSAAHDAAWKDVPYDIAVMRARRAEALGLTYREYTLEILERGRYLSLADAPRIAEIKLKRPLRY